MAGIPVVDSLVEMVATKAVTLVIDEVTLLWGLENEVDKLAKALRQIHAMLGDAGGRHSEKAVQLFEAGSKIWNNKPGDAQQQAKEEFTEAVKMLEGALGEKDYFGGASFGYLDVVVAPFISWFPAYERCGGFKMEDECPGLAAWTRRCAARESVAGALPDPDQVYELVCMMRKMHGVE